jgi:hypothetical protein
MTQKELENGYWWAYKMFYTYRNIFRSVMNHDDVIQSIRHLAYTVGWKIKASFSNATGTGSIA